MVGLIRITGLIFSLMMATSSMSSPVLPGAVNPSVAGTVITDIERIICAFGIPLLGDILGLLCPLKPTPTVPDTTCENSGLEYAITKHQFRNNDNPKFTRADPEFFKKQPTIQEGTTSQIGFSNGPQVNPYSIYKGAGVDPSFIGVNHRGYLYSPKSAIYTLVADNVDDILFCWVGQNAFNGKYTRANANLVVGTDTGYTVFLEAGIYYPFRILYLNSYGLGAAFGFNIKSTDGTVLATTGIDSPYFVKFSCDGKSPKYQSWADETAT